MTTRIHVNQHIIKANRTTGGREAPLTAKTYRSNTKASEFVILDGSGVPVAKIVYRPDAPMDCGAHVWVETEMEVFPVG